MKIPELVRFGLNRDYESGFHSDASHMLYEQVKKSPEEISRIIRETWGYIKTENKNTHVLSHFLFLLKGEVERAWVEDISIDIVIYCLNYEDTEVIDNAIHLIESWHDKDMLDLLYNTEIKIKWLEEYKMQVLKDFDYMQ